MEASFTMPYSEFEAIRQFQRFFPKAGYGVFIPASRQQAGVDFLLLNAKKRRLLRVQLKSSRAYIQENGPHPIRFWFNNFLRKYRPGAADIYAFLGVYPGYSQKRRINQPTGIWKTVILVFEDAEIGRLLRRLKTKGGKVDRFFAFGLDVPSRGGPERVYGTRGQIEHRNLSRHLLRNKVNSLRRRLG